MTTALTCPQNDSTGVCDVLAGAGAGLGIFVQDMGIALPALLIILGVVGIIVAVGYGIAHVISKGITGTVHTR